jgi:hypothetical protein
MKLRTAALACLLALVVSTPALQADGKSHFRRYAVYEVTVTNVTYGQIFTPLLVVAHHPRVALFKVGQPASPQLEMLAEDGKTDPLKMLLARTPGVHGISVGGAPLPPGHSTTMRVKGHRDDQVSLAGMLIPTNDGFVAVNGAGPFDHGTQTIWVPGYDAGTEINDESCASIPGPHMECPGGMGSGGDPGDGEGFVRIHEGIHGVDGGDFEPADRDWRNPVAQVRIRRIR